MGAAKAPTQTYRIPVEVPRTVTSFFEALQTYGSTETYYPGDSVIQVELEASNLWALRNLIDGLNDDLESAGYPDYAVDTSQPPVPVTS